METLRRIHDAEVTRALPMTRAIALMRRAFAALSTGSAIAPQRASLDLTGHGGRCLVMPSYLPELGLVCVKTVNVCPDNPARGLPRIHGLIQAFDAATGRLLALIDAEALTAIRTGAASGLASERLALPGAETLAVFGTGVQARTQVAGVCAVRPVRRLRVYSRDPARAARFAAEMADRHGLDAAPGQRRELVRAEIVCTATPATEALFDADELHPEAHINAVGSFARGMRELPPALMADVRRVVDERGAACREAGEVIEAIESGTIDAEDLSELGELGDGFAPRPAGRSLFKSVGHAVQDLVCVHALLKGGL